MRPNGAQANKLLIHSMIRVSVATGDQFSMQLSDIVAASFPSSGELFERGIKRGFSPARLLLGKRATLQPARDRGMTYPNLGSLGRLREALFAQGHDAAGIEQGAPLASPASAVLPLDSISAAVRVARWREEWRLTPESGCSDEQPDDAPASPSCASPNFLITWKRSADFRRLWSACCRSSCIVSSTISTHCHQIWILAHPGGSGLRFALRQQIHDVPGLQIDENRAKPPPTPKRKIVSAQKEDRFGREIRQIHDAAQNRLTGGSYSQAGGESGSPFAASCQADRGDLLTEADGGPGPRLDKVWEPLGKHFSFAVRMTAAEFANGEAKLNLASCAGHIPQSSLVVTMDRG